jgi:hypothetical protein
MLMPAAYSRSYTGTNLLDEVLVGTDLRRGLVLPRLRRGNEVEIYFSLLLS